MLVCCKVITVVVLSVSHHIITISFCSKEKMVHGHGQQCGDGGINGNKNIIKYKEKYKEERSIC